MKVLGFVLEVVRMYLLHIVEMVHTSVSTGKILKHQNKGRIFLLIHSISLAGFTHSFPVQMSLKVRESCIDQSREFYPSHVPVFLYHPDNRLLFGVVVK